jgi:hypothetical protein
MTGSVRACPIPAQALGSEKVRGQVQGSGRERPDVLLSEACPPWAGRKRPVHLRLAMAPDPLPQRERYGRDPSHGCSGGSRGASATSSPLRLLRFPEANLGPVCRPSGRTVGTGAAVAPAVSGRLPRGASISPRHPGREARPPDRRLRNPEGFGSTRPAPAGGSAAGARRPWRIVHRRLPSFSGPRTGKPGHPNLLSGGPKPSGGRLRSARDPPLFGTGKPAPERRFRERLFAPAAKPRSSLRARVSGGLPPASASGRIRKLRRLLRTCAGSAPSLGAW